MQLNEIKKLLKDKEPIDYDKLDFGYMRVDKVTGKSSYQGVEYSGEVQKEFETIKSKYSKSTHKALLNKLQYNHNLNKDFHFDVLQFYCEDDLFKNVVKKGLKVVYPEDFTRTVFALFKIRYLKESDYQTLKANLKNIKETLKKTGKHANDLILVESFENLLDTVKRKQIDIETKYLDLKDIEKNIKLFLN